MNKGEPKNPAPRGRVLGFDLASVALPDVGDELIILMLHGAVARKAPSAPTVIPNFWLNVVMFDLTLKPSWCLQIFSSRPLLKHAEKYYARTGPTAKSLILLNCALAQNRKLVKSIDAGVGEFYSFGQRSVVPGTTGARSSWVMAVMTKPPGPGANR